MNKLLLIALLFISATSAFAQSAFMPGYFIDNTGTRTEGFIRNGDRLVNPSQFEYKLTEGAATEIGMLSEIKEFGILNTIHKYQRFKVNIDRSGDDINNLSPVREPEFKEETLFLRVLVEGEATLYYYAERGGLKRFFFNVNGSEVEQLIYKRYSQNQSLLGTNEEYKKQLFTALSCQSVSGKAIDDLFYQQTDLVRLFKNYNACVGSDVVDYTNMKKKGRFGLAVKAGVNVSALESEQFIRIYSFKEFRSATHDRVVSPQASIEAAYTFAFNNGKLSVFIEPTYQQFKYADDLSYVTQLESGYMFTYKGSINVDYSHITIPVGIRYAVVATENSRFSLHGAVGANFLVNKTGTYKGTRVFNNGQDLNFQGRKHFQTPSFILGMGYKYRDRFSLEAGYHLYKIVVTTETWEFKFKNSVSVVFGYNLF